MGLERMMACPEGEKGKADAGTLKNLNKLQEILTIYS